MLAITVPDPAFRLTFTPSSDTQGEARRERDKGRTAVRQAPSGTCDRDHSCPGAGEPGSQQAYSAEQVAVVDATSPLPYDNPLLWLCGAAPEDDLCLSADLTATRVHVDGSVTTVAHQAIDEPDFDCFPCLVHQPRGPRWWRGHPGGHHHVDLPAAARSPRSGSSVALLSTAECGASGGRKST